MIVVKNAPDSAWEKKANQTIGEFIKTKGINPLASVNVFFVNRTKIRTLNKKYRNIDALTDVLSFPIWKSKQDIPKTGEVTLGDIFICPQEATFGKLEFLIRHSLNHLIGKHHY